MSQNHMKGKMNVGNDGKSKKRMYYDRKNTRRTNIHLDGTEIGEMLAQAVERKSQEKLVENGGI